MLSGRWVEFQTIGVLVAAIAGCTKPNPLDCSDGTCSDQAHPYCDKDGTVDGSPNTCIAVSCSAANEFVECKGDTAVSCNATGDGYDLTPCAMGCSADAHGCNMCVPNGTYCTTAGVQSCGPDGAPTTFEACAQGCVADPQPHCAHLVPRYLTSVCDSPATTDFDQAADATLGTDLDTSCTGGIVQQTAAPEICVVRNKTITIDAGVTLKATGGRLLALVADDSLAIHGTLDASADGSTDGPGGGSLTSGGGRQNATGNGGGGAGFKTAGGAGASNTTDGGGANGGAVEPDPAQLAVMVGGPRNDGGGGGGVILVACRGAVAVDGLVDVGGGGGGGGYKGVSFIYVNAGGGGAGGYLVLQGWSVAVTGNVFANGGGGGAGYSSPAGRSGADGSLSSSVGAAGGSPQGTAGRGGAGSFGTTAAAVGGYDTGGVLGGQGGGGGGLGYLQTYTPTGVAPTITPMDSSPVFQPNLTVQTE
jgi:hypothetical protein